MLRSLLLTSGLIWIMCSAPAFASIELVHQLTFSVPGLSGPIEQTKFKDINNDGFPEVLASDGEKLVLYSISLDSVLLSAAMDSGLWNYRILLDDVNRDSLADVVVADCQWYLIGSPCTVSVALYDGSSGYTQTSSTTYTTTSSITWLAWLGITALDAMDINNDGYNELFLAFDSIAGSGSLFITEWTAGTTYLYNSFPDSICWQRNFLISDVAYLATVNDTDLFIATRYKNYSTQLGPDCASQDRYIVLFDSSGEIIETASYVKPKVCDGDVFSSYSDYLSYGCFGNIDNSNEQIEIVSQFRWGVTCIDYVGGNFQYWDTSGADLVMHRIVSPDTVELVWSYDVTGTSYSNFLYHPDFPGYFFAITNNTLIQFNGVDGSVYQSSDPLPEGTKFWSYPFGGDMVRLVVLNNNDVSFYRLDIATSVADASGNTTVPSSFTLHQPYPNPFNAELTIPITLNQKAKLNVDVLNLLGQHIATVYDGAANAGNLNLSWDAGQFSSGVYFIKVSTESEAATVKAILLK